MLATATKSDVRFSITARQDKRTRAAIDAIEESGWQPIPYWLTTPQVLGTDIAETPSPSSPATSGTPARCAGSVRHPGRSSRCSPPGTTTLSSPTETCRWPTSRPTTGDTRSSSRPASREQFCAPKINSGSGRTGGPVGHAADRVCSGSVRGVVGGGGTCTAAISGEEILKSAVARLQAMGMLQTTATRSRALTSGSCGCGSRGSHRNTSRSISPSAIRAPICWSPP